jgi:hypothetical protein
MKPTPDKIMPALYGGLLIATIWAIPGVNFINIFCCAGVLMGGFVSVLLYQKNLNPDIHQLTQQDCVQVGLYAGIIASVAMVIIQALVTAIFGDITMEIMLRVIARMHLEIPSEMMEKIEESKNVSPSLLGMILQIVINIIPNGLFGVLGALIGWNVFKPKE